MTRIVICGGPRTGKTTLASKLFEGTDSQLTSTDTLIELGWSEASQAVSELMDAPGPWIIEGVAASRALRKWREAHPGEPPPVDKVIRLTTPHVPLTKGQAAMAKGEETVWQEIGEWLGWKVEHRFPPVVGSVTIARPDLVGRVRFDKD